MKTKIPQLILAGLFASATALPAATTLIDGFGTLTLTDGSTGNAPDLSDAGSNWYNNDGASVGPAFEGVMTATTLTIDNDPFENSSRKYETPTAKIISNTSSGSILRFSFDYNVTAGSPSLYFHLKGIDETGASPNWEQQLLGRAGAAYHAELNNTDTYNLFDGTNPADTGLGSVWGYNGGLTNLTGSGTISGEINLSTHGTYTDLSEYEYLAVAFAFDFDEAATIEISNFSVAVPEPSSTALLGLGLSSMLLRRRRS